MSLLSENNLITDDILFEYGFRKNEYICDDMSYNTAYVPGHFYKEIRIKVRGIKIKVRGIKIRLSDCPHDLVFYRRGMLDYDPSNQFVTLFCDGNIFPNGILFREKVEDEIDLKAIISYVENHIYD